ncbi:chitinase CLP-like [Hordeum vulgare subsp. vulgare]|uniref:Peptidase A1 domain-containing protein n=1 Tax=Hordeum vulgare subsp. vulgare TaxID=112509 RepID=A0A8I6Y6K6_HORVV|nr:chitinase CLP-like [Hordeum vulgare subsp. vulgare]
MDRMRKNTPNPNNYFVLHRIIVSSLLLLLSCTAASGQQAPYKPLISRLAKDLNTSLYTITIKADKSPLLLDLAGSLVWSTCSPSSAHGTVACGSGKCGSAASQECPCRCMHLEGGQIGESGSRCACAGNPVTRQCSTAGLRSFAMSANSTDGAVELLPEESFDVLGACAPGSLPRLLPAGATGVAGFSRRPLSLPSQLAAQRGFGGKFALCLPVFAIFGDSPVNLSAPGQAPGYADYTTIIPYTPLLTNPANPAGYYIPVKGISVSWHGANAQAILPSAALDLDTVAGTGGVVLSTATPYMIMRPDLFDAFAKAFDDVIMRGKIPMTTVERVVPAPKPFKLCYSGGFPLLKRPVLPDLPRINLELGAGATRNWTLLNNNYMVQVDGALCLAILPMGPGGMPVDGEPAVVIGAKQMENNLLVFDVEKQVLGFSMLLDFSLSSCISSKFFRN